MSDNMWRDLDERPLDRAEQLNEGYYDPTWSSAARFGLLSSNIESLHTPLNLPPFYPGPSSSQASWINTSAYPMSTDRQVRMASPEQEDSPNLTASTLVEYSSTPPSRRSTLDTDKQTTSWVPRTHSVDNGLSTPVACPSTGAISSRRYGISHIYSEHARQGHTREGNAQQEDTGNSQTYLAGDHSSGPGIASIERFPVGGYPQIVSDADLGIKESFEGSDYSVVPEDAADDSDEWVDLQARSEISLTK
ncbi:hypothetical protein B0T14DRAFT_559967 [Immersiella caudata]|uniref:Uncharacterized protein n=1 Tax=Immersiella caudata TaxID=314043 RepID=A0AA40CBL1_9PEZI|nr:hypothetical protein B0T14DRAFT_559967 [Immersiella caudata]